MPSPAQPVPTDAVCLEDRVLYSAVPFELPAEPVDWSDASELAQFSLDAEALQHLEFVQPGEPAVTLSFIESLIQEYDAVGTDIGAELAADQVQNLVFINQDVDQIEQLIADFADRGPEYQVFVLDDQSNGIGQISKILGSYSDLASLHLISHGSGGQVNLGNSTLSLAELDQYEDQLTSWNSHLSANADILFYGCDLAATEDGRQLIESLAELTDADIAASDDLTGHQQLGGDWVLEFAAGQIETEIFASAQLQQQWLHTLDVAVFQQGVNGYIGTVDTLISSGSPDADNSNSGTLTADDSPQSQVLIQFEDMFGAGANQIAIGSTINSVTLTINVTDATLLGKIDIHEMLIDWNDTDSWNSLGSGISLDEIEAESNEDERLADPDQTGAQTFILSTTAVQNWADGEANYGWVIVNDDLDGMEFRFIRREHHSDPDRRLYGPCTRHYVPRQFDDGGRTSNSRFRWQFGCPRRQRKFDRRVEQR